MFKLPGKNIYTALNNCFITVGRVLASCGYHGNGVVARDIFLFKNAFLKSVLFSTLSDFSRWKHKISYITKNYLSTVNKEFSLRGRKCQI